MPTLEDVALLVPSVMCRYSAITGANPARLAVVMRKLATISLRFDGEIKFVPVVIAAPVFDLAPEFIQL
jgi:hypothetical protein